MSLQVLAEGWEFNHLCWNSELLLNKTRMIRGVLPFFFFLLLYFFPTTVALEACAPHGRGLELYDLKDLTIL